MRDRLTPRANLRRYKTTNYKELFQGAAYRFAILEELRGVFVIPNTFPTVRTADSFPVG